MNTTDLRQSYNALVHAIWHALDDSETRGDEVIISLADAEKLGKLIPFEHPKPIQPSKQEKK